MKKWKLVMSVVLCAIVGLFGLGCGPKGPQGGSGNVDDEIDPNQTITLNIQSAAPLKYNYKSILRSTDPEDLTYKQALFTQFVVEGFKVKYPNIKLNFIEDGWGDALHQKNQLYIRNWQNGGRMAVDIMIGETYMGYYAEGGVFEDLGKSDFADVVEGACGDVAIDGKLYGVPMCTGIFGLQYNTKILTEAGIPADKQAPKTWDELLANSKTVADYAKANNKQYTGIVLNNISGMSSAFRAVPFMRQAGGDFFGADGNLAFNSAQNVEAFTYLRNLAKYTSAAYLNETSEDALQYAFCKKDAAAYMVEGQWAMVDATSDIKSAALPVKQTGAALGNCYVGNVLFGVTKGSSNKAASKAFLKYLTSSEVQLKLYELDGRLPVNRVALSSQQIRTINPAINSYVDALLAGGFSGGIPCFTKNASTIWTNWGTFIKNVYTSTDNIKGLADGLQADIARQM